MASADPRSSVPWFREVLRRTRRTRKPEAFPVETTAVPAKPEDSRIFPAFKQSTSPLSPAVCRRADALREKPRNGHTVITRDEKGVSRCAAFCGFPRLYRNPASCRACGLPRKRSCRRAAHRVSCGNGRCKKSGMGADRQCSCRAFLRTTRLSARRMDFRRAAI